MGLGEIPDLKLLVDWCKKNKLSIIQILPINDSGFTFTPYNAETSFAIDPIYLSIEKIKGVNLKVFKNEITKLKMDFQISSSTTHINRVNFEIKQKKLDLLNQIFETIKPEKNKSMKAKLSKFEEQNKFWLYDYALFKVLKEDNAQRAWEDWEKKEDLDIVAFKKKNGHRINFQIWLQWQLFIQLKEVKRYANKRGVLIMGDLPFLVSRDSADVWVHKPYFKLDLASGAPPDFFNDKGQRWGMPPYHWENIAKDEYLYLKERLKYAQNFYDMFRIDHAIGLFRVWTIDVDEDMASQGVNGNFDPSDEDVWEEHGRNLLVTILESTSMLPCAEDLGVVPRCSYKVLEELCIPGMEIQRWSQDKKGNFINEQKYRKNSITSISTHDTSGLNAWWIYEASKKEKRSFCKFLELESYQEKVDVKLIKKALQKASDSSSVFAIQALQDWLSLTMLPIFSNPDYRVNIPSTIDKNNWSILSPFSLEEMKKLTINKTIKKINSDSNRR